MWHTSGTAAPAWGSYGCDSYNSGACVDTSPARVVPPTTTTDDRGPDDHERGATDVAGGGGQGRR